MIQLKQSSLLSGRVEPYTRGMQPAESFKRPGQPDNSSDENFHAQDYELASAALAGSLPARQRFSQVMTCVPRILAVKNLRLGGVLSTAELEDLSQETVLTVWRKLETYRGAAALTTWTYRFCHLGLLAFLRKRASRAPNVEYEESESAPVISDAMRFDHVYRALDRVDSEDAEVIRMKHFDSLSFDQIAERKSMPASTVKTNYYRALKRLRDILGPDGPEELS